LLARAETKRGSAHDPCSGEALAALEHAARLAEGADDLDTWCDALSELGWVHLTQGTFARSKRYWERALAIAERLDDPVEVAFSAAGLGLLAFHAGDWILARAHLERALSLSRQADASWHAPVFVAALAHLCLVEGAWEEAAPHLDAVQALALRRLDLPAHCWTQSVLAERDLLEGHPAAAQARLASLPESSYPWLEALGLATIGARVQLDLGDLDGAQTRASRYLTPVPARQRCPMRADALWVRAMVLIRQQRWADAEGALEEGLVLARSLPYPYAEAHLLHAHGIMCCQKGTMAPARERLEAALAIFRRLGARKDVEVTELLLATLG
jgi:tetratricopeptide (TPR) repeat protein